MADFQEIIKLRNEKKTQKEISRILGISEKTIRKYLREGKIPEYKRSAPTKKDPFKIFEKKAIELIEKYPSISSNEILNQLQKEGYEGSYRTISRKTELLRKKAKAKPAFFERKHLPGNYMEGDFTELKEVPIGGEKVTVNLWLVVLIYSNKFFASPFYNQQFESFAQGSIDSFKEFGGTAKTYRLDNLKPVVFQILKEGRAVTSKFRALQDHFDFRAEFCNPASGWEKGDVESMAGFLKRKIRERIHINNLNFSSLNAFKHFVWDLCRQLNRRKDVSSKSKEEVLRPLPIGDYKPFRTYLVKVNKYSTFSFDGSPHRYSAPNDYIGLNLEARVSAYEVELYFQGERIAHHQREFGKERKTIFQIEHIIVPLNEKPGVVSSWKYKDILFDHPVWERFYEKLKEQADGREMIKEYLRCLKLFLKHGRETVTLAMEIGLEEKLFLSSKQIEDLILNESFNPMEIQPVRRNLIEYDHLLKGVIQ